jgi:two-component system cell cycle sensor histidine kinase/response regulator CckA
MRFVTEERTTPQYRAGGGTILFVEDEPAVRGVCQRVLEREGHRLLVAADADEALGIADSSAERIDLLLTDMVLPKMGGCKLYERLRATRQELRVLYISGYTKAEMICRGMIDDCAPVLEKPFTAGALLSAVRARLESKDDSIS